MQSRIKLEDFPGMGAFIRDYARDFDRVNQWFDYDPHEPDAITTRLADLAEQDRFDVMRAIDRGAWAAAIHAQQQRWRAGEAALAAARSLAEPETYVVATGQQTGLFGGPLYTVHKAASAVAWARKLSAEHPGKRFIPIFWLGASDSDFDEVRRTYILGSDGAPAELALPREAPADAGRMVSVREVAAELSDALTELEQALPGGIYRDDVLAAIREDYATGSLVAGFARWMARLFGGTELLFIDEQDPVLMDSARGMVKHELATAAESEKLLTARTEEIAAAGYPPQAVRMEGDTGLFLLDETGRRLKIARHGDGFILRQTGRELAAAELEAIAGVTPERFVPSVSLRPLYQDLAFPTALFIGGAAEIAYRAQMTTQFHHHGRKMAPAVLRQTMTLLPAKLARLADELGLDVAECFQPLDELVRERLDEKRPAELAAALAEYRRVIRSAGDDAQAQAEALDPALGKVFDTLRDNLGKQVDKMEKKVTRALKRQHDVLTGRLTRLSHCTYPLGQPQERVLNLLSFLPQAGFGIIGQLIDACETPAWDHLIVSFK